MSSRRAARRSSGSTLRCTIPAATSWLTRVLTELPARCRPLAAAHADPGLGFDELEQLDLGAPQRGPGQLGPQPPRTTRRSPAAWPISSSAMLTGPG